MARGAGLMRFQRVLFVDDFLRTRTNGVTSYPVNRKMVRALFDPALRRLGMEVHELFSEDDGGSISTTKVMASLGLAPSSDGWAQAVSASLSHLDDPTEALVTPSALVIGFGMTPSQLRYFDRHGCSFIDLEIHPWRFEPELSFSARTNDPAIKETLARHELSLETAWNAAARLRAIFARRRSGWAFDPALSIGLFVGQTQVDLSLVQDGALVTPAMVSERVAELASEVDVLLVKSHPYELSPTHLQAVFGATSKARHCTENVYALMSCTNVKFVAGLSSGALSEAPFFHQTVHRLLRPDRDNPRYLPASCSDWLRVSCEIASINAVAKILGIEGGFPLAPFPADTLSRAIGVKWGGDTLDAIASPPPVVSAGTFALGTGGSGTPMLAEGWSPPEGWGTWSEGPRALMRFSLQTPLRPGEALHVAFTGFLLLLGTHAARVRLHVPGRPPVSLDAPLGEGVSGLLTDVCLPATALPGNRFVELCFEIENPTAPSATGESSDQRLLGLALTEVRLEVSGAAADGG